MRIDLDSWPEVSLLLDQWLDLPEEARANWLENLGPEHASALPVLRRVVAAQARQSAEVSLPRNQEEALAQARTVRTRIQTSGVSAYFKRWEARASDLEGKGLLVQGRSSEALPLLQRAVELGNDLYDRERSPALTDSQIALARCFLALGRRDRPSPCWLGPGQSTRPTKTSAISSEYRFGSSNLS
jgi:hypothetical protein